MNAFEQKKQLRLEIKNKFQHLNAHEWKNKVKKNLIDRDLSLNLFLLFLYLDIHPQTLVGGFAPLLDREPLWYAAFLEKSALQFKTAFPKEDRSGEMIYLPLGLKELHFQTKERKEFGVMLKAPKSRLRHKEKVSKPDLLLIPGVAFDKRGNRLGRGKAYFDRYLKHFAGLKIGLAYEFQLVERLPVDEWDRAMDMIVTEKTVYFLKDI